MTANVTNLRLALTVVISLPVLQQQQQVRRAIMALAYFVIRPVALVQALAHHHACVVQQIHISSMVDAFNLLIQVYALSTVRRQPLLSVIGAYVMVSSEAFED